MKKSDKIDDDIEFITDDEAETEAGKSGGRRHKAMPGAESPGTGTAPEAAASALVDKTELAAKDAKIAEMQKELDELQDKYLRKVAEMENLRKRLDREKSEYYDLALSGVMAEMVTVLDNLERALDRPEDEADGKSFREGIELIYRLFKGLLAKHGIQPIDVADKKFDPNIHHATSTEEIEGIEDPEIAEVLQKGYYLNNRLLRPALVRVFVPKKD